MDKQEILVVIRTAILEVMPELSANVIRGENSLRELGTNSIDRAEILIRSMEMLRLKIPLLEFGQAKNIDDIIAVFLKKIVGS